MNKLNKALPYGVTHASKALEPATLVPLQLLKSSGTKCIMVGDPKQLPATVLSNVASKYLYECSMFECLQRAGHPVIMLMLTEQGTRLFVATKLGRIRAAAKQALLEVVQAAPNSIGYYARGKVDVSGRGLHGSRVPSSWSVNRKGRSPHVAKIPRCLYCWCCKDSNGGSTWQPIISISNTTRLNCYQLGSIVAATMLAVHCRSKVEVSGGRGKPSRIVDKDEGLGKVSRSQYVITCVNLSL
ncbi:hypothetical protein AHAS_Ahas19G0250900 [Arachis hypogaea]